MTHRLWIMGWRDWIMQAMISIIRIKVVCLFVSWWFPILPGHVRNDKMNWLSNTFRIGKFDPNRHDLSNDLLWHWNWPFRSSATTTLRPNIAIVRDSGTTQTIVNNAIVNNGSRVPISRNIVKNMDPVRDHIARVNTVCWNWSNRIINVSWRKVIPNRVAS